MTCSVLPNASAARLTVVLTRPGTRSVIEQYAELRSIMGPIMRVHYHYESMALITNTKDFRAMGFWLIEPAHVATMLKTSITLHEPRIECAVWAQINQQFRDHHGRVTWRIEEIEIEQ